VLFQAANTRQRDDPPRELSAIFGSVGVVSLDREKPLPDEIECARQGRFGVVTV
jgi:hypothetical protein